MAAPAWFWPQKGAAARSIDMALTSTGLLIPDWRSDTVYPFTTTFGVTLTGPATFYPGFCGGAPGATGAWFPSFDGSLSHLVGTTFTQTSLVPNQIYVACAAAGTDAYIMTNQGQLYNSAGVAMTNPTLGPTTCLAGNGNMLWAIRTGSGFVTNWNVSTNTSGSVQVDAGVGTGHCLSVSGANVAVAGATNTVVPSGAAQAGFFVNPANPGLVLGITAGGTATIWTTDAVNAFVFSTSITGIGAATNASWAATGTQALVTNGTSVIVLNYSAGVLSIAQTIPLASCTDVLVMPTSVNAAVCNNGQVTFLTAVAGAWSIASSMAFPGASALALYSANQVALGMSGSAQVLTLNGGVWTDTHGIAVPYNVTQIAVDSSSNIYTAGTGLFSIISADFVVVGNGTFTGNVGGIVAQQAQIAIVDTTSSQILIFGSDASATWSQRAAFTIPAGFTGIGVVGQSILVATTASALVLNFGAPYTLVNVQTGTTGLWNGTAWTVSTLGVGQIPTTVSYDNSGVAQVATILNQLFHVAANGTNTSSVIETYPGQSQDVPLGVSSICVSGTSLFGGTSMPGVLVQIA